MTPRHLLFLLLAAVVAGVLGVGAALSWPIWIWFLLPALVAGVLLLGTMLPSAPERAYAADSEPDDDTAPLPPVEPPYLVAHVSSVPVESAKADYPFLFSAVVRWRAASEYPSAAHGNPAALAVSVVLRRVRDIVAAEQPDRCGYLQHWLEGALGAPLSDDAGLITAYADDVRLTLSPTDQRRLDELEDLRKSEAAWAGRREHERDRRAYLGDDVLRSPGSAVVWWMARHEDEIERAVDMIAPLTCLSAAANDKEIPQKFRHLFSTPDEPVREPSAGGFDHPEPMGDGAPHGEPFGTPHTRRETFSDRVTAVVDELGLEQGEAQWTVFLRRLAGMCDAVGRKDAADRIRQDLLHVEDEGPRGEAEEGPPAPEEPAAGPVPGARSEDVPTARANGYGGTAPEEAERAEPDWWDGPQARSAPGAEPFTYAAPGAEPSVPPVPGTSSPTYLGQDDSDRNGFDEGPEGEGAWR
ncbi:hypothetical protein [Streptomyces sp. PTD5-9]|uniref:hypothetical protein n=1 Tax=Streptomyces sp. PTD5-9 TaxID=3120150 RepID=UPI003008477D